MEILNKINSAVWGAPTLLLIFFTGVILSLRTNFFALRHFGLAAKLFFGGGKRESSQNRLTPLQSASTALSATMGTGNIVGVAGAVALGGPDAVFWMWASAAVGMMIKYGETVLAVKYRRRTADGWSGGAMEVLTDVLHCPRLAALFAVGCVLASFGMGCMAQANAIAQAVNAAKNDISADLEQMLAAVKEQSND